MVKTTHIILAYLNILPVFQLRYTFQYLSFENRYFILQFTALIVNCIGLPECQNRKQQLQPEWNASHWFCSVKRQLVRLSVTRCSVVYIVTILRESVSTSVVWLMISESVCCAFALVKTCQVVRRNIECYIVSVFVCENMKFQKFLLTKLSHRTHKYCTILRHPAAVR